MSSLANLLDNLTTEGELYEALEDNSVRCHACGHRCLIHEGRRGICQVRFNEGGKLRVPFGYVAGLQNDPIEKKPFSHVLPGANALTFGMLGCDYHCSLLSKLAHLPGLARPGGGCVGAVHQKNHAAGNRQTGTAGKGFGGGLLL